MIKVQCILGLNKILYPRQAFVDWFMDILRTKKLMSFHSDLSVPKRIFPKIKVIHLG